MTDTDTQSKLAEYEGMVRLLTAKLEELAAENARLRSSENNAHSVLREVYNDPTASPAVRVKAAGLALPHETPRLESVAPPLELTANKPADLPLAEVVRLQRARTKALEGLPPDHPRHYEWSWSNSVSELSEKVGRLESGADGNSSND
jgi:hypothetical protein